MTESDWGALALKLSRDIKDNLPPPAPAASGDLADVLDRINASLPAVITALRAHQGVLTAADDLLQVMSHAGVTWAATADAAVLAAPGALSDAQKWLPTILWALTAIAPASPGLPDATQGARGHVA